MIYGVDVSKKTLDFCILDEAGTCIRQGQVANDEAGIAALLKDLGEVDLVAFEATGVYSMELAMAALERSIPARRLNPKRIKDFVAARGQGRKTDALDAQAIAEYARLIDGPALVLESGTRRELRALCVRARQVQKALQAERNRREGQLTKRIAASIKGAIEYYETEQKALQEEMDELIANDAQMAADAELLGSIKGIGQGLIRSLLASLPDLRSFDNARQLQAYLGLAPVPRQSGSSLRRAYLPKGAHPELKAMLYRAAMGLANYHPEYKAHKEQALARGKARMSIIAAHAAKLLRTCYGVLKQNQHYHLNYRPKTLDFSQPV